MKCDKAGECNNNVCWVLNFFYAVGMEGGDTAGAFSGEEWGDLGTSNRGG